jgi:two-component system sensor histidine kinase BaeS
VRIEAELTGETVVLRVIDTGEGILPDQLPHVFERFRKAEDSPGSGLGLAIARSLIEAHGGTIRASSALGEGTKITIELPVAG